MDEELTTMLYAALNAIMDAEDLDQARGIAHAAINGEEYHGHELETRRLPSYPEWFSDEDEERLKIIMPYLVVESEGGPYHDMSFVAGYQCGQLDGNLQNKSLTGITAIVYANLLEQIDLIAMKNGFTIQVATEDEEWAEVRATRT